MTLNLFSEIYYKIISSLSKLVNDKYWLGKIIAQSLPLYHFKRLKIDKCSLFMGKIILVGPALITKYLLLKIKNVESHEEKQWEHF